MACDVTLLRDDTTPMERIRIVKDGLGGEIVYALR